MAKGTNKLRQMEYYLNLCVRLNFTLKLKSFKIGTQVSKNYSLLMMMEFNLSTWNCIFYV